MAVLIHQFPCLQDNYGFLVHDTDSQQTACIDTPDADEILRQLKHKGWQLTHIWNTHWHPDHAGGNIALKTATGAKVYAPIYEKDRIDGIDHIVSDGNTVALGRTEFYIHHCPGHTLGHIIYHAPAERIAFVGDVIFKLGCGRVFEGTMDQMFQSLQIIKSLSDDTALYCAHEYSLANAEFSISAAPSDPLIQTAKTAIEDLRDQGHPTVPTTVAFEKKHNLFLRAKTVQEFSELRQQKDRF